MYIEILLKDMYNYYVNIYLREDFIMKKRNIAIRALSLMLSIALAVCAFATLSFAAGEAQAFVNAVNTLNGFDTETELEQKHEALLDADEKLDAYLAISGHTVNDSAVKSACTTLTQIKTEMFIKYVELAFDYNEDDDYPNTRKYLNRAELLVLEIDKTDRNASAQLSTYNSICAELKEPEETCATFILRVEEALAATSYGVMKEKYEAALYLEGDITLEGYEGIEEAKEKLVEIETKIVTAVISAKGFIDAVDNIYSEKNVIVGVNKARAAYKGLDATIDGVPEAKERLDSIVRTHDKAADAGNELAKETSTLVYALVLGTGTAEGSGEFDIAAWFSDLVDSVMGMFS